MFLIEIKTENGETTGYWREEITKGWDRGPARVVTVVEATRYPTREAAAAEAMSVLMHLSFFVGLMEV